MTNLSNSHTGSKKSSTQILTILKCVLIVTIALIEIQTEFENLK